LKIGIFSDTHDNILKIKKTVNFFNKHKVGFVFHAGDFIAPFVIPKIQALHCDWRGVFGNNDGERNGLSKISRRKIQEAPLRITLAGRRITLVHELGAIDLKSEKVDLVIFGHTHRPEVARQDDKILVNPGECGGWLTGKSTVALVDLVLLTAKIYKI
jgi:putative phosphoesterase